MSTLNEREAALRRALHMAADAVDPSDDGLQFIRARLVRPRPLAIAWAEAAWTDIRLRAPAVLEWWLDKLTAALNELKVASISLWKRFGPTPPGKRRSRTAGWLRPLGALGVFVAIVAVGAYASIAAQNNLFPSSVSSRNPNGTGTNPAGNATGTGGTNAHSHSPLTGPAASASPTCRPRPASSAPSAPPGGSINSTTPSITPSITPSVTPSSSASGATNSPAAGASASPTSSKPPRKHRHQLPLCTTGSPTHRITVPHTQNGAAEPTTTPSPGASASGTSTPLVVRAAKLSD